ncbi:MAG: alpha-glucan family phosphorylase [Phycisphaeraceae bacterium]|nr:alpha-glucan family phosphorylase [Phycisphaeraceae bacterium]
MKGEGSAEHPVAGGAKPAGANDAPVKSAETAVAEPRPASSRGIRRASAELRRLARDVRWAWSPAMRRPFQMLDPFAWSSHHQNPLGVLDSLDPTMLAERLAEPEFARALDEARSDRRQGRQESTWFRASHPESSRLRVAYFCSEFGLHESMPQYAGGLGILAGDHLRSAADLGVPVIGVGLLYAEGYYRQELRDDGSTRVLYPRVDCSLLPLRSTGITIECPVGRRQVRVRVWWLRLGRTKLYLLDTDLRGNAKEDRHLTRGLYRGEPELRLRQQVLLGVGGVLALDALREPVSVLHLNEGHAAFATIARAAQLVATGVKLEEALLQVRRTSVFTTHTPVPAGHDRYDARSVIRALRGTLRASGMSPKVLLTLGRERPGADEPFCMTALALRLAEHCNGVAALHGRVSRAMWKHLYERSDPAQVPIGHITNGVHLATWTDPLVRDFWREEAGIELDRPNLDRDPWASANRADPARLWALRHHLRQRLVREVRSRLARRAVRQGASPLEILQASEVLREDALTICFARRFATYKRAPLIFSDPDRLARILGDASRPVQIIFAGKAHPQDRDGQLFARRIHAMSVDPRFRGRVALVEEYDMGLARVLVSGADVWLNTPRRPHEASGTSGMKVAAHGGINLSIADGWWPEAADGRNGWTIGNDQEAAADPESMQRQDEADARSLYELLEHQVVPEFFDRSAGGVPEKWMDRALHSAASICGRFNTHRMVAEYLEKAYLPAFLAAPSS